MQIGSVGSSYGQASISAPAASERTERGPENDKDSDDSTKVAAASKPLPTPPAGRGGKVDMMA
ncbi:MAG: hypothetical protein ACM3Q1_09270 [Bacteroidales bacterium]